MMEHGLALSAQLMFTTAMRTEALKRAAAAGAPTIATPRGPSPSFDALLARGQVALMRTTAGGGGGDVSVLERIFAPEARVHDVVVKAGQWADFVPGVDKSYARTAGEYQVEMSVPIVSWATAWALRDGPHAIDGAGVSGDLSGARFRWDLSSRGEKETLAVYRVRQKLDAGSLDPAQIIRTSAVARIRHQRRARPRLDARHARPRRRLALAPSDCDLDRENGPSTELM